ncbi:adrenocortical dysplasia protein homolog [Amphiprion ocellaris]|uniref:adrenocortical dysplasia protein homolog n=1 Tax=Amphiprion ocellaris TaxID=80972 RepID=UPI002410DF58|nr:adrenocortical dysplasia protein homolog [Amphiprion ocellaris]XP_023126775.2 adrenocortical dysplasia protein homolog [Amphiprion ocellaris]
MLRPARNRLTPWIESLILSYSVPEEDEEGEEEHGGRSRGQLRAHVVGVNHMSESQAQLQSSEDPTGLLYLSDGQLQIPTVLTAAAWEHLQDQEDRECFTSLLNSTVCIQDYRLLFHMAPEETRCRFFLSVGQLATVAAGPVKDKPPCCSTLNSVQGKIRLTWRALRGQEDSESQDGHELTVLLDEWQRDVLEELKQDIRRRLNPQPSTSSHQASSTLHTTGWDLDRIRYKGEEPFSVPMRYLLIPEDAAGGTRPSGGEAQQQRSEPAAVEVWEDAKSSPSPVEDKTKKPSSSSPSPVEDKTKKPSSSSPSPVEDKTKKPSFSSPSPVEDKTKKPSSSSPSPVEDKTKKPSFSSPSPVEDKTKKPSFSSPSPVEDKTKKPSFSSPSPVEDIMKKPSSSSPSPVEDKTKKPSFSSPSPVEEFVLSEDIVLPEDMMDRPSFSPWDIFPPLCLSPSSSESSSEDLPPPNPDPAAVHSTKESSFLPAYQNQPSSVVQPAASSSVTPPDKAPTGQNLPAVESGVEETVERKARKMKRKRSDPSPEALSTLVEEELSTSPPSWLFDSQAGSEETGSSSSISPEQTTGPVQRKTPSMHSDSSLFSYSYRVTGQNLLDLSRFKVASSLLQWSVKYLLNPDQTDKTQNVV